MRGNIMNNFDTAVETLLERIGNDFERWTNNSEYGNDPDRVEKFRNQLSLKTGRKYVKILTDRSVWGFVQIEDDKKFKKGDILMAAGYDSPARNKARGNIFEDYSIQWTGPNYLF